MGRLRLNHASKLVGLSVSGGLDSCILLKHLLDVGRTVKPFYIRSGLCRQAAEQAVLECFLDAVAVRRLEPLSALDLLLGDVDGDHWSITGHDVPAAGTPDEAVYLPGHNALLTMKAALWCQMRGIDELAIATRRSNPFEDASASSFDRLGAVLSEMGLRQIHLMRPFGELEKRQVMELGQTLPLKLTLSCIASRGGAHYGRGKKCAERQEALIPIGMMYQKLK